MLTVAPVHSDVLWPSCLIDRYPEPPALCPGVFLSVLLLGPSDSGGVCSVGPCFVYGMYSGYTRIPD